MWRTTTLIWATAFLLDAAVRVVMIYALPINDGPAVAGALWLATFVLLQIATNSYLAHAGLWSVLRGDQPMIRLGHHVLAPQQRTCVLR
jgi:hypothetical protein